MRRIAWELMAALVSLPAFAADMPVAQPMAKPLRELYVAPDGKADAAGTKDAPLDLSAVFTKPGVPRPGDTVWMRGGSYKTGPLKQSPRVCGTKETPLIFRAVSGERAIVEGELELYGDHTWLWGFEITASPISRGAGVNVRGGDGIKLINLVIHDCSYPLKEGEEKRPTGQGIGGWDVGDEDNHFMCGANAMEVKGVSRNVTVRGNTFWASAGMVSVAFGPDADKSSFKWDENTYIANGRFSLDTWRKETGFDRNSKLIEGKDGRPAGLFVLKRVNKYDPGRLHVAVYNWDHQETVTLDLAGILRKGDTYRVVSVLDFFGEPVAAGKASGPSLSLCMKGHRYEPEFGAYVLFREQDVKP